MNKTIDVAKSFQTSINISYDIHNKDKVKSFIPTQSSIEIIEDIMLSTNTTNTDRSRMLVGAYGKGKSHIVLVALNLLFRKDKDIFRTLLEKISNQNDELYNYITKYINSTRKILPIIISGSSISLTQSFLNAMQLALKNESLSDLMPETNFKAALKTIEQWKIDYPQTYGNFMDELDEPIDSYIAALSEYDVSAYEHFVRIYPSLTAGSTFNPFVGLDVVELYEKVNDSLYKRGYDGIFIVYDEFSKYLESSINNATISDIKLLQDFAEKCSRSGKKQMHLLLIAHKDISNYIDEKLPKEKVDGWRGVSGRFKHVSLHNNFSQMYEIISSVIMKNKDFWIGFSITHKDELIKLSNRVIRINSLVANTEEYNMSLVEGCYPLHPITTFMLPRISEKVAQNERTLFTFLSSNNKNTLSSFINDLDNDDYTKGFPLLTPDTIYDYFEQLLRKEHYNSDIYIIHKLTTTVLREVAKNSLHRKIIKTLALIYIIEQFEKLPPTKDIIVSSYGDKYRIEMIEEAINDLIDKNCIIYLKRSNNYLKIKENSGIDIKQEIENNIEKVKNNTSLNQILNESAFDNYMYPTAYNDENDMVRYFEFSFISCDEFLSINDWEKRIENISADGVVFSIIPSNVSSINRIKKKLKSNCCQNNRIVFIVPKNYADIEKPAYEYHVVKMLQQEFTDDEVVFDEYGIYIDDLEEVIGKYIFGFTRPENQQSEYYYKGVKQKIRRKAQLSNLISEICTKIFINTPVINNELINKNELPTVAIRSRNKMISGLLENTLEYNLGLSGSGQDVSFMRSTLIQTGILNNDKIRPALNYTPDHQNMANMIDEIVGFFVGAKESEGCNFSELYDRLINPKYGYGVRKGIIPIYIAVVLHNYKKYLVIKHKDTEVRLNADLLTSINKKPENYIVYIENWSDDKDKYIEKLSNAFKDFIIKKDKDYNTYSYVIFAMVRWYMNLPKYSKDLAKVYKGRRVDNHWEKIQPSYAKYIKELRKPNINAHELLFNRMYRIFGYKHFSVDTADNVIKAKELFDNAKNELIQVLAEDVKNIFASNVNKRVSLASVIKDFYEPLNDATKNHIFSNGEHKILSLISSIGNDNSVFIQRLAKAVTQLRIDDWSDKTIDIFVDTLHTMKKTILDYDKDAQMNSDDIESSSYRISFVTNTGEIEEKTFSKVEYSKRAKLLYNEVENAIDEMGQAISDNEKRQVLIDIIQKMIE